MNKKIRDKICITYKESDGYDKILYEISEVIKKSKLSEITNLIDGVDKIC